MANAALRGDGQPIKGLRGLLGESVEIGPPLTVELTRDAGRNLLMISPSEGRDGVIAALVSAFAKSQPELSVIYFDGTRVDDDAAVMPWLEQVGVKVEAVKPRDCERRMQQLSGTGPRPRRRVHRSARPGHHRSARTLSRFPPRRIVQLFARQPRGRRQRGDGIA